MASNERVYYHKFITCPDCHEPHNSDEVHKSGLPLVRKGDGNTFICSSCKSIFTDSINFVNNEFSDYTGTVKMVNNGKSEEYLSKFPLIWKVEPNIIETEYLNWIKTIDRGKFLITWPWKRVKFLPLLVSEYYLDSDRRNGNVVVIYNPMEQVENEINEPDMHETFKHILYIDGPLDVMDSRILEEYKKFDKKSIFIKKAVTHYRIKEVGRGITRDEICTDSFRSCINQITRFITTNYGNKYIRSISQNKLNKKKVYRSVNENGTMDLIFEQRLQRDGKLNYRKEWIWNVLTNYRKIKVLKTVIPNIQVKSEDDKIPDSNRTLFMIPSTLELSNIYKYIDKINPSFLMIDDVDYFIKDLYSYYTNTEYILKYVKRSSIPLIMMFSTDPSIRNIYAINSQNTGITDKYGITVHTWDSELLLPKIAAKNNVTDNYPSPVSSLFVPPDESTGKPDVEYIPIKELDNLDELISIVGLFKIDENIRKDISGYLKMLKMSTLKLKGDYLNNDVFTFKGSDEITYDILKNILRQNLPVEEYIRLISIFNSIFLDSELGVSPIMKRINRCIEDIAVKDPDAFITIVTYHTAGTKELLETPGISNKIEVCTWDKLNDREKAIGADSKHYVISTISPSVRYSLYRGNITKLIFIGSEENVDLMKINVNNRLSINKSKPLYKPDDSGNYPELLKDIIVDVSIPSNEVISRVLDIDIDIDTDTYGDNVSKSYVNYSYLKKGEKAYLIINEEGNGMLIPEDAQLTISKNGVPDFLDIGEIQKKNLKDKMEGKEIFIDSRGISISIKDIFTKFMLEYKGIIRFRSERYQWNGFIELYNSSTLWRRTIEEAVELCKGKNNSHIDCDDFISEYLAKLGLTAGNQDYIKSWWTKYYNISAGGKEYKAYNIEHPKSMEDLVKICRGLNEKYPYLKLEIKDLEESYVAARTIQKIRKELRDYIGGDSKDARYDFLPMYESIKKRILPLFASFPTFRVKRIYPVEIKDYTAPFKIMERIQYDEICKVINRA